MIQEWNVFAVGIISEEGEDVKLAPVASCHHCRLERNTFADGLPVGGKWHRCSCCKKTVCGPDCGKMGEESWGAVAEVTGEPIIEGLSAVERPPLPLAHGFLVCEAVGQWDGGTGQEKKDEE